MISALVVSTLLSMAVAQKNSTLVVPLVGGDADMVAASVVGASGEATTLALGCVEADCGLFPAHTLIVGPSTYNMDMSDPNTDFTATQDCVIASSSVVCKETAGGSEANFPGSSTTTYDDVGQLTVTVTAGGDKLTQTGSAAAGSVSASQTTAQSAATGASTAGITPAPGSGSAAASAAVSSTGSAPGQASTAGAAINGMLLGGGFFGAAAGVFGGLLL